MANWRDISDRLPDKAPTGTPRSSQWRKVRDEFMRGRKCAVCEGRKSLVAHHVIPFHIAPDLELDPGNLVPLCEAKRYGVNCHLLIGHLGNFRRCNVSVHADIAYWHERIKLSGRR